MKKLLSGALALTLLASAGVASAQPGRDDHRGPPAYDNHRGPQPQFNGHHNWHRGGRLPTNYRNNNYVVNDWRARHLRAPPRGYHWVKADNDYVLAAVATGLIASIIAGR